MPWGQLERDLLIVSCAISAGIHAALTPEHWARLRDAIADIEDSFDYVLIDTAAGVSDNVLEMLGLAERGGRLRVRLAREFPGPLEPEHAHVGRLSMTFVRAAWLPEFGFVARHVEDVVDNLEHDA